MIPLLLFGLLALPGKADDPATTHLIYARDNWFDPNITHANPGDVLVFHFTSSNHSVVMSDLDAPCVPSSQQNGFFSGFLPTTEGENPNVFKVTINDTTPFAFYCSQATHCASGMVGAVNAAPADLDQYACAAKSVADAITPSLGVYGGTLSSRASAPASSATGGPDSGSGSGTVTAAPGAETTSPGSGSGGGGGGGASPYGSGSGSGSGDATATGTATAAGGGGGGPGGGGETGSPTAATTGPPHSGSSSGVSVPSESRTGTESGSPTDTVSGSGSGSGSGEPTGSPTADGASGLAGGDVRVALAMAMVGVAVVSLL
ncbi:Cupredoxin [Echria macrotheca]|uniref:Cupredoxin n=1 Tax=Echria macrotheca TaxID=438768 RepID=A0AAJ0B9T8_9PEZI|nr:Cupredoxin [Echria macrotheca]